jgi:hypothetical protein
MPKRQSYPRKSFKATPGAATPLHTADVCLLSLERCRALLPRDYEVTDAELERLRDGLYALAGVAVDGYLAQRMVPANQLPAKQQTAGVPADARISQISIREPSNVEGERD